jgi:outer membrane protein OmpU
MKKILLSTTLLVATAGVAAAEITLSGSGRFGINYDESRTGQETQLEMRFRTEFNGVKETDSGVTFGGRVRMQYSVGTSNDRNTVYAFPAAPAAPVSTTVTRDGATLSAAYVYASYEGLQVQVGNANGALDSAALMYNSEIGYTGFGAGDPIGINAAFSSSPYTNTPNRVGIFVTYGVENLNVYASYHTFDQTVTNPVELFSIAADYKFDAFTISGGYESFSAGVASLDTDTFALGAEYAINDAANVGILYFDVSGVTLLDQNKFTLYGNYTFDAITLRGFISGGDNLGTEDMAYGMGVDYDLGGAKLAAGIQSDFNEDIYAEAGVSFSF